MVVPKSVFLFHSWFALKHSAMCLPAISFPALRALLYSLFIAGVKLGSLFSLAIQLTSEHCHKWCPSLLHYCSYFQDLQILVSP